MKKLVALILVMILSNVLFAVSFMGLEIGMPFEEVHKMYKLIPNRRFDNSYNMEIEEVQETRLQQYGIRINENTSLFNVTLRFDNEGKLSRLSMSQLVDGLFNAESAESFFKSRLKAQNGEPDFTQKDMMSEILIWHDDDSLLTYSRWSEGSFDITMKPMDW